MGKKIPDPDRQLACLAYIHRENDFQHHAYISLSACAKYSPCPVKKWEAAGSYFGYT